MLHIIIRIIEYLSEYDNPDDFVENYKIFDTTKHLPQLKLSLQNLLNETN